MQADLTRRILRVKKSIFTLIALTLISNSALADFVPNATYTGRSFNVVLDLSGYRDAAVAFTFASLVDKNPAGIKVSSAPGTSFVDGYHLLDPLGSIYSTPVRPRGFLQQSNVFSTAMFNLAAYDGQTVLLSVTVDREDWIDVRGVIDIRNLKVEAAPIAARVAAANAVPEPSSIALLLVALLAMAYQMRRRFPRASLLTFRHPPRRPRRA
jgi:hypothetical protein